MDLWKTARTSLRTVAVEDKEARVGVPLSSHLPWVVGCSWQHERSGCAWSWQSELPVRMASGESEVLVPESPQGERAPEMPRRYWWALSKSGHLR